MKKKPSNQSLISLFFLLICSSLVACTPPEVKDLNEAANQADKQNFRIALSLYDQVVKRSPDSKFAIQASREAAKIALYDVKDYQRAVQFYRFLVLKSDDPSERVLAQKALASTLFENLQDYGQAISEYNKLLSMSHTELEGAQYKLAIARSMFYLGDFFQANSEISEGLRFVIDDSTKFSALLLRGNIFVAQKDFFAASKIFSDLIQKYPEKSKAENVYLSLAICLEESGDYAKAIDTLQPMLKYYQPKEYVELRIKRLQDRKKNQPGAKGFRK